MSWQEENYWGHSSPLAPGTSQDFHCRKKLWSPKYCSSIQAPFWEHFWPTVGISWLGTGLCWLTLWPNIQLQCRWQVQCQGRISLQWCGQWNLSHPEVWNKWKGGEVDNVQGQGRYLGNSVRNCSDVFSWAQLILTWKGLLIIVSTQPSFHWYQNAGLLSFITEIFQEHREN